MSPTPPSSLFPGVDSHRRVRAKRARGRSAEPRNRNAESQEPLSEALFREALVRERRRADRFEHVFVLVLVAVDKRLNDASGWPRVLDALGHATSDSDITGWYERGAVLGLIRSLDDRCPTESAAAAAALHQDLVRCLTPENAGACSFHLEVYSPHSEVLPTVPIVQPRRTARTVGRATAKRLLDIAGSAALLTAFAPVMITVAILVKSSSKGPVFFRQHRVGKDGRLFPMLKFRTMQVNCDPAIHQQYVEQFIAAGKAGQAGKDTVFKIVDDPRVTRIGHFLRRSSLDEFPQFLNVLAGQMSLVGPRPPLPYEVAKYKGWHRRRVLEAKPGITGLWQVTGRSRTTFDEMVRLDLRYARTYSVWADLKILLATPRAVLTGKGAH